MKKNKFIHITNWILLFSIPFTLLTVNVKTSTINSEVDTKNLNTSLFEKIVAVKEEVKNKVEETEEEVIDKQEVETKIIKEENKVEDKKETTVSKEEVVEEKPVIKEEVETSIVTPETTQKTDVIETFTGNLSYYRANCYGCSGFTATGFDVRDGKLFYNDPTYGNIRIIASGTEIPKYSIVRIKNSSLGTDVLAIVLDRGGDIGQGRKFIVDVLTNSTEAKGGVDYGVSIEVIRKGK